jgi:hypothetical protein
MPMPMSIFTHLPNDSSQSKPMEDEIPVMSILCEIPAEVND